MYANMSPPIFRNAGGAGDPEGGEASKTVGSMVQGAHERAAEVGAKRRRSCFRGTRILIVRQYRNRILCFILYIHIFWYG